MNLYAKDPVSFMAHGEHLDRQDQQHGPLAGHTLAIKDLYDVRGYKTGAGNPTWLDTHPVAGQDAWAVERLLGAGAHLLGKTLTDEMAYSLIGANHHYGTPPNPAAPDLIPGGSSSGSASVVAQGLVDIALGTDTGGSVRIPASFCGLYGFRPSHGRIPVDGLVPLGPSFDTVGWFTRDGELLQLTGSVLLETPDTTPELRSLICLDDLFANADPDCAPLLLDATKRASALFGQVSRAVIAPDGFKEWCDTYRYAQGFEAWREHGDWVTTCNPRFGPLTQARFDFAKEITEAEAQTWNARRAILRSRVLDMLGNDTVLCLPTAPGSAIARAAPEAEFDAFRGRILDFTAVSAIAGTPEVTIPIGSTAQGPIGLSLIGPPGSDMKLLRLAGALRIPPK